MQFTLTLTSWLFTAAVFGKIVNVKVGQNGLAFDPDNIMAAMGDQVQFTFYPTVSRTFALPLCRDTVDQHLSNRATRSQKPISIARVTRTEVLALVLCL